MHEEFQSNQEGANDQHKRRTLCHSKVILKRSTIVTCYLVGKEGRRRRGRSGKTTARCFLGEVRKTPSRGLKLSLSPLPGDLSLLAASHTTGSSPGWFRKSLRLSKRSPWPRQTPVLFSPFLSHVQPQETQVSETLSSLALQVLSLALPAAALRPHRAASRGSLSLSACPGTWSSSSPANSGRAPSAAAPASGSVSSHQGSARQLRRAVNRSWRDSGQ